MLFKKQKVVPHRPSYQCVGLLRFYESVGRMGCSQLGPSSHARIRPRDKQKAGSRTVNLTELTNDDVICWFHVPERYAFGRNRHVRYDANAAFDEENPVGYQWSRVQIDDKGVSFASTRQVMCMFCQWPAFFCLAGTESLWSHFATLHPHEVPQFLWGLMAELDLAPKLAERKAGKAKSDKRLPHTYLYRDISYRTDGKSNVLSFAPRSTVKKLVMKLADVTEESVMFWYRRDIDDYQKYQHSNLW